MLCAPKDPSALGTSDRARSGIERLPWQQMKKTRSFMMVAFCALLCACGSEPPPADPALLAALDSTLVPNSTTFVRDGKLVTGLYFIVDSGYGFPRKVQHERLYIDPAPIVTAGNLQHIRTDAGMDGTEVVVFDMDPLGAARWQVATRKSIGKRIAIVVRDEVISSPIVQDEIPGGRASLAPGMGSSTKAEHFAKLLVQDREAVPAIR